MLSPCSKLPKPNLVKILKSPDSIVFKDYTVSSRKKAK
ncbi:hypothetical protein N0824_02686 [Microcystis sp. 0824]|nr:hypothetical protein N0824_02686 [Microcystis sp. 0824]